jgi:hypothetical protein
MSVNTSSILREDNNTIPMSITFRLESFIFASLLVPVTLTAHYIAYTSTADVTEETGVQQQIRGAPPGLTGWSLK